jgi:hypothetical protein
VDGRGEQRGEQERDGHGDDDRRQVGGDDTDHVERGHHQQ